MINYTLDLSVSDTFYSPNRLISVTKSTNSHLYEEVYKIAKYFKEELNYDFVPFDIMGIVSSPYEVLLFTEEALDKVQSVNNATPYRIYGACLFTSLTIGGEKYWVLEWIWFHPFFRHRGKLREYWDILEEKFGNFFIREPISSDMENFLGKMKSEHKIIPNI